MEFISNLIEIVESIGVDKEIIIKALESEMKDFEDCIQISAAELNEIEYVITRNEKDFIASNLKVFNPKDFVRLYINES